MRVPNKANKIKKTNGEPNQQLVGHNYPLLIVLKDKSTFHNRYQINSILYEITTYLPHRHNIFLLKLTPDCRESIERMGSWKISSHQEKLVRNLPAQKYHLYNPFIHSLNQTTTLECVHSTPEIIIWCHKTDPC